MVGKVTVHFAGHGTTGGRDRPADTRKSCFDGVCEAKGLLELALFTVGFCLHREGVVDLLAGLPRLIDRLVEVLALVRGRGSEGARNATVDVRHTAVLDVAR